MRSYCPKALPVASLRLAAVLAITPALAGCNGALIGNLFVLAVTVGIFFGTLGLGRSAPSSSATQSGTAERPAQRNS